MRSRLSMITTAAALAAGAGIAFLTSPSPALADYTPPALVDAQTFPVRSTLTRLGGGRFGCHSICRSGSIRPDGGVQPLFCSLVHAIDAGAYVTAGLECAAESNTDCTPQAVGECASPVQP